MPANNRKDIQTSDFLWRAIKTIYRVRRRSRATSAPSAFLVFILLIAGSFGCAPTSHNNVSQNSPASSASDNLPELTDETIRERLNGTRVRPIPEENGTAEPISWSFVEDEPKEISVVEKQIDGERAVIILDIKTRSAANARDQRYLAGQIRTKWELQTGWVLRRWEIVKTENISMKFKNLPKPSSQNSNR